MYIEKRQKIKSFYVGRLRPIRLAAAVFLWFEVAAFAPRGRLPAYLPTEASLSSEAVISFSFMIYLFFFKYLNEKRKRFLKEGKEMQVTEKGKRF